VQNNQWGLPNVAECQTMEYTNLEMRAQEFNDLVDNSSNILPDFQVLQNISGELANITTTVQPIFPRDLFSAAVTVDTVISYVTCICSIMYSLHSFELRP